MYVLRYDGFPNRDGGWVGDCLGKGDEEGSGAKEGGEG